MSFVIRCSVSGGVTGNRSSVLKHDGVVLSYETREEAAAELQARFKLPAPRQSYSYTNTLGCTFKYWVDEA